MLTFLSDLLNFKSKNLSIDVRGPDMVRVLMRADRGFQQAYLFNDFIIWLINSQRYLLCTHFLRNKLCLPGRTIDLIAPSSQKSVTV
jgi:hypothetical protein